MTSIETSGLNAGYVSQLLEQYLDNPEAVDPAWRELFERVGTFDPRYSIGCDTAWFAAVRAHGLGPVMLDSVVLEKRMRDDSLSSSALRYRAELLEIVREFRQRAGA